LIQRSLYLSWGIIISVPLRWVINSTNGDRNNVSLKHIELNKEGISSSVMLQFLHCAFGCLSYKLCILKRCYVREDTDPLKPKWLLYILLGLSSSNSTFLFTQCVNVFLMIFAVCVNSDYCLYTVSIFVFVMETQFIVCVVGTQSFCVTRLILQISQRLLEQWNGNVPLKQTGVPKYGSYVYEVTLKLFIKTAFFKSEMKST
jgi:hypothetical protein